MEEQREHDELKRTAPTLFGLPKQDPFVSPEAFFGTFPHQVQARVTQHPRRPFIPWIKRASIALPVLALIVLCVRSWNSPKNSIADTPVVEVTALTDAEIDHMDAQELMASVDPAAFVPFDSVSVSLTDEEALAYIEHEDLDLTELIAHQ